ncbi:MAG: 50S ribosomal protein L15 [Vampirovibrionales bacterium]
MQTIIETTSELNLTNVQPAPGSVKTRRRVGRGRSSGMGKTCCRGHNGEGQRAGNSSKRGFEGGQMPAYRRLPKFRTFAQPNKKYWLELNVGDLELILQEDETILTLALLKEFKLLRKEHWGVRILGAGEVSRPLTLEATYVTPSAKEKLEAAGCTLTIVE